MTINLIDARRGLHNKCLELFADKNIAEKIYRYLCDGIEDCEEEAEPIVQCKDCKWYREKQGFCVFGRGDLSPNDYCSFAERKDDNEE